MKKKNRYSICIMVDIVCIFIVSLVIIEIANNQKEHYLDLTTEMASQKTFSQELNEETEKIITEEITIIEETRDRQFDYIDYGVPNNNTMKTYMDFRTITSTNSRQYKLQQTLAYTDDNGLRMVNGRYCVAVGSYYTSTIGQYIDIELENGKVIRGILADCKDDKHTDSTNRINPNGSVIEFVVDIRALDSTAKTMGDISYINGWDSKVVNIRVYDTVEDF